MKAALESVGFASVIQRQVGESDDAALRGIEHHGAVIGERWNAMETFVVEARKPAIPGAEVDRDSPLGDKS
jgi:hypothetical protein